MYTQTWACVYSMSVYVCKKLSTAWLLSVTIFLPSCLRQCAFHENDVNIQKEATEVDRSRDDRSHTHTHSHSHMYLNRDREREKRESLEE